MPRTIGLTGNIACGKTAVGHMLLELGAEKYIDADAVVHQLYQTGQPIAIKVGEAFGAAALAPDGSVDRKALGDIVFHDTEAMQRLEAIVHPAVGVALMSVFASDFLARKIINRVAHFAIKENTSKLFSMLLTRAVYLTDVSITPLATIAPSPLT